jgi:hypothetical protein
MQVDMATWGSCQGALVRAESKPSVVAISIEEKTWQRKLHSHTKQHCSCRPSKGAAMHSLAVLLLNLLNLSLSATTTNDDGPIKVDCPSETNYTSGGAFDANLHALLSSLPAAAAASSGFAKNSTGALPDQAFGFAQCRADIAVSNASTCRACLDSALGNVKGMCSSGKTALILYEDCVLRYSDTSFFGAADTSWWRHACSSENAQPVLFMQGLHELLNNLTSMAAYGTPRMFAAGALELTPYVRLYGMARCTRDLAGDDCMACLSDATDSITKACNRRDGARIYYRSCSVRYEVMPRPSRRQCGRHGRWCGPEMDRASMAATTPAREAPISQHRPSMAATTPAQEARVSQRLLSLQLHPTATRLQIQQISSP